MTTSAYHMFGGSDPMRVETFGMFSALGTDSVANIIENALDGATVEDLRSMIQGVKALCPEITDTVVRENMILALPVESLAQHTMCDALGVYFGDITSGAVDASATLLLVSKARTEALT